MTSLTLKKFSITLSSFGKSMEPFENCVEMIALTDVFPCTVVYVLLKYTQNKSQDDHTFHKVKHWSVAFSS